ncbi:MAG: hypothetical protein MUC56_02910 [Thermoanaerobaculales bacterium]|nr:hypothetical protein [Thermoanaerobaculales bacterium]
MSEDVALYRSFLKRLPLTLVAAMVIWLALRPVLDTSVAAAAQLLTRSFEYPRVTRLVVDDHQAKVHRTDFRTDSGIPAIPMTEKHFNTIVLLALYLALPKPLSRRQLERLFMGWCILFLTQSLNVYFHVKCLYALSLGEWSVEHYSDLARDFYGFWRYFTDLPGRFSFPFLIWLGFNWNLVSRLIGPGSVDGDGPSPPTDGQRRKRKRG